jgi:hypothetical protein
MAVTTGGLAPNAVTSRLRTSLTGTPGMLRAGLAACLVALALFAWLAADSTASRKDALTEARAAASQAVLIQQVHTSLVEADSLATNAFLVGGIEPAQQREGYEAGIAAASQALAAAAGNASGGDLADLESVNAALVRYTGLIESARANNRQGFPVGVAYLRQASQLLTNDVLRVLDEVSVSSQEQVDEAYDDSGSARWGLWIAAVIVLAALVACQLLLSRATRRTLNVGLLAGTALVLVGVIWGGSTMSSAASTANDARDGPYATTVLLAQARIDAFSAKSAESLTLINRGNGSTLEAQYLEHMAAATEAIDEASRDGQAAGVASDLAAYDDVHRQVRDLDDDGDWDAAVRIATGFDDSSSNELFARFDTNSAAALEEQSTKLDDRLGDATGGLGAARFAVLLSALLAAVAVGWGFNLRMKEYR